jgi:hypothetical protein
MTEDQPVQQIHYVTVIIVSLGKALAMPTERIVGTFDDVEEWVRKNYTERELIEVRVESQA